MKLRDYQREALDAVWYAKANRRHGNAVVVELPTGSGKTVIFAHLARDWVNIHRSRVLILAHRDELITQTAAKLRAVIDNPHLSVGIVKAGRNDVEADIIVASVQTLASGRRRGQLPRCGLVIVDEAHHAVADTYRAVLDAQGVGTGEAFAVGFTATLMRGDGLGLDQVWNKIVYRKTILWMIEHSYLVDVRGTTIPVEGFELDNVKSSRGDYQAGDLGDEMEAAMVPDAVAKAYQEQAADRLGVLFAPTVDTAHSFAESLVRHGITSEVITGETPIEERRLIYKRHEHGETQVLTNCMVLTEGWDSPATSACVVARPTKSNGLYIQMVGRVLRPFAAGGKRDALVLDVVGATRHNSLATLGSLRGGPIKDGQSLIEAELEELGASDVAEAREKRLILDQHMVEARLFEQRPSVWLRTTGDVWFIPSGPGEVFLAEQPEGGYVVGLRRKSTGRFERHSEPLPLEMAMAVGEELCDGDMIAGARRSWRTRTTKPSDAQLTALRRFGVAEVELPATKREASDLLSVLIASRALSRFSVQKG